MIELKNVNMIYPNGFQALYNINLKIEEGEFVAIIGSSGAGKSTLIRCINKMIDFTSGDILVQKTRVKELRAKNLRTFRQNIGMLFQNFNLIQKSTAVKNVLSAQIPQMPLWRVITGIFTREQKIKALEMLQKVGILDKAYMRCDTLSGGEQQRVALARTLNQNPKIILADEPVASLDPLIANQVMKDFKSISRELKITILVNIHNVELALQYADRIIGIRSGKIAFDKEVKEVTQSDLDRLYSKHEQEGGLYEA